LLNIEFDFKKPKAFLK